VTPRLVLLVEDTEEIRTDIREMLRALGHSVIEAGSAVEALALADLPEIDLVLSDINLPGGMNGLALAETLRERGSRTELRLMTSLPLGDATRHRAATVFPVLGKPFDLSQLAAFIELPRAA
jgi:CheY-like chemotaxis protein